MATAAQVHTVVLFGYVLPKIRDALKAPVQRNTADAQRRLHGVEPSSTEVLRRNVSHATAACLSGIKVCTSCCMTVPRFVGVGLQGRDFTIVFRTFGADIAEVVEEMNAFATGQHPSYPEVS